MNCIPPPLHSSSYRTGIAVVLICVSFASAPSNAQAPSKAPGKLDTQCSAGVTVRSRDRTDAQNACRGALAAIEFFRKHGVRVSEPLEVGVVDELPPGLSTSAVGCFNPSDRKPYVLSYQMFLKRGKWLELQIDRRLYESIASHEVAHALAWCAAASPLTLHATEYIAFVTTFATMDPVQLNTLLAAHPGIEFGSEWEISGIGYALDPIRFGIMAYRHYLRQADRAGFIREILAGRALTFQYHYY